MYILTHLLKDTLASEMHLSEKGICCIVNCNAEKVEYMAYPTGAVISNPISLNNQQQL